MLPSHKRALRDITECRTGAFGGHVVVCDHCGCTDYCYHSCKNRSCPTCHRNDTKAWLCKRQNELLPVVYFHLVFTLPKELRSLVRKHQNTLYDILMKTAAQSLTKLAADPKYVGGKIGMLAVLHTWTRAMIFHPHVHFLVPAGGVSPDGNLWLPARNNFLVPVEALSTIFRAKFMKTARKALPHESFPEAIWQKQWVVYCKPVQAAEKALEYLSRYVYRIAITNNRIVSASDGRVSFRYKDSRKRHPYWRTMTLPAVEFLRRFLQHVLPRGFHKVRYYGLLSPANRQLLMRIRFKLGTQINADDGTGSEEQGTTCRHCGVGIMIVIAILPRGWKQNPGRSPP